MSRHAFYEYVEFDGERFFTLVSLPDKNGKFPTVISRSPYVKGAVNMTEEELLSAYSEGARCWNEAGYATVFQHCRGMGKSTGQFIPYVVEKEDGIALRQWIREQSFYNGELYLSGGSYSSSLQYSASPYESDVLGAILEIQDSERYRLWYRNGQMRKGHANWHFGLYKDKCGLKKDFSLRSFSDLPLAGLSRRVLNDYAEDFEQMLGAPRITDPFWQTRNGGVEARDAVKNVSFPVLLSTGYNDFYVGGVFRMWQEMESGTREKSALLVSPYDHGDGFNAESGLSFENGKRGEEFGSDYRIKWLDSIRLGTPLPFKKGVITYYRDFENRWDSDFYALPVTEREIPLGDGEKSIVCDPKNPPAFREEGRLAENFDRNDVLTVFTPEFSCDTFVKGQMRARLTVSSSRPDTSFYIRVSIVKPQFTYVLRHDITSLCYQLGDYTVGSALTLDFTFDEHAFLISKGDRLRLDISFTDDNVYVCHTNNKGAYHLQSECSVAENTVCLSKSTLILPVEDRA